LISGIYNPSDTFADYIHNVTVDFEKGELKLSNLYEGCSELHPNLRPMYQDMRNASFAILREIGVDTGGSNVQFSICPNTGRMIVIEMNPRVSRSSALASKATGERMVKNRDAEKAAEEAANSQPTPPTSGSPATATVDNSALATTAVAAGATGLMLDSATADTETPASTDTPEQTPVADAVLENALNSDDDFERAFAAIDMERAKLHTPLDTTLVADAPNVETANSTQGSAS
jgi:hypothetical protein